MMEIDVPPEQSVVYETVQAQSTSFAHPGQQVQDSQQTGQTPNPLNPNASPFDASTGQPQVVEASVEPPTRENFSYRQPPYLQWSNTGEVGSVSAHYDKGWTRTDPKDYDLGCIILAPHVIPSLEPHATMGDDHVGYIPLTGPVIGKMRPAVVVGLYPRGMICLPLKTNGGRGIVNAQISDAVRMRQWNDGGLEWANVPETQYLVIRPRTEASRYRFSRGTFIDLCRPFVVEFEFPIYRVGDISRKSWSRLKRLWLAHVKKGMKPIAAQSEYTATIIQDISNHNDFNRVHDAEVQRQAIEREARQRAKVLAKHQHRNTSTGGDWAMNSSRASRRGGGGGRGRGRGSSSWDRNTR